MPWNDPDSGLAVYGSGAGDPWYNVKDPAFGARGDGITDDSVAVNKIPAGYIFFPPGSYLFQNPITPRLNSYYVGAGMGQTSLIHSAGGNPLFAYATDAQPANIAIRDLKILKGTGTGDAISFGTKSANQATNLVSIVDLRNIFFFGLTGWAVNFQNLLSGWITRCLVNNCGKGFWVNNNACSIRDNSLSNSAVGTVAIQVGDNAGMSYSVDGTTIDGNVIESWRGAAAVLINASSATRVINNHFEDNNGVHLQAVGAAAKWINDLEFAGNRIVGADSIIADSYCLSAAWIANQGGTYTLKASPDAAQVVHTFLANSGIAIIDQTSQANGDLILRLLNRGDATASGILQRLQGGGGMRIELNNPAVRSWHLGLGISDSSGKLQAYDLTGGVVRFQSDPVANQFSTSDHFSFGRHLIAADAGVPVSSALGANVTSVTPTGNDTRGELTIVMAGALAANTRIATITFAATYGATPPKVILVDQTSAVGIGLVNFYVSAQATGVSFDIASDQALGAGTYKVDYIVIG